MRAAASPIDFAGSQLNDYRHVCAFFSSPEEEEYATLLPFVLEGFRRGERAYHVIHAQYREPHLEQRRGAGINVATALLRRQLEVTAKFTGRVGLELDLAAAVNVLGVARQQLESLDKVRRVVRRSVSIATAGEFRDHARVADAASQSLQDVLGRDKNFCRFLYGVQVFRSPRRSSWKQSLKWPDGSCFVETALTLGRFRACLLQLKLRASQAQRIIP